jgi:hypothetical protein
MAASAVVSAVASAVSVPLIGRGVIAFPRKRIRRLRVRALRMKLILCETCRKKAVYYPAHPWWSRALKLGYDTFLDGHDLWKLKPVWLSEGEI